MRVIKYLLGGFYFYLRRCSIYFKDRYYKEKYPGIDNSVIIGFEVIIDSSKDQIKIGGGTYIQRNCQIVGNVMIGKNCSIASNVNIWAMTHDKKKDRRDKVKYKNIKIGDNVWIGANSFIREGVEIGSNCIVGANSVVTRSVPNNSIFAGSPAKKIGEVK